MFSSDVMHHITSLLSDEVIEELYVLGLVPTLPALALSQSWWYARVVTLYRTHWQRTNSRQSKNLTLCELSLEVDWKRTYQILDHNLMFGCDRFYNQEDNPTALEILKSLDPTSDKKWLQNAITYGAKNCVRFLLQDPELLISTNNLMGIASYSGDNKEIAEMLLDDERIDATLDGGLDLTLLVSREARGMLEVVLGHPRVKIYEHILDECIAYTSQNKSNSRPILAKIELLLLDYQRRTQK